MLARIVAPITFARSCDLPGLQAADLAAYLHRRRETVTDQHPRARATLTRLCGLLDLTTIHRRTWVP
ncbi:DUF3800 domain-containing protein [Antribacter gilvus]|uniref:DUF3800 domain-containing protein n=1 Tax=Antribacter gilvus TaxID=2304675 RepID=UPI000F7B341D|nr:DUF3800 domain-containing protein [Antribacter gilvus]